MWLIDTGHEEVVEAIQPAPPDEVDSGTESASDNEPDVLDEDHAAVLMATGLSGTGSRVHGIERRGERLRLRQGPQRPLTDRSGRDPRTAGAAAVFE